MEAIIFDVDGTLWDAKDEIVYSWNKALEGWPSVKKRLTGEMMTPELGKPMDEIMDDLFPELSPEEQDRLAKDLYRVENKWVESAPCHIYEGLEETIRELSGRYQLMIVRYRDPQRGKHPPDHGTKPDQRRRICRRHGRRCAGLPAGGSSHDLCGLWIRERRRRLSDHSKIYRSPQNRF